jgi:hypothetical protein
MPFEQFFFNWFGGRASEKRAAASPSAEFYAAENFEPVFATIAAHEATPGIRLDHAYFSREKPCTMLIDEVEALWEPIADNNDWSAFHAKLADIAAMREAYSG